MNKIILNNIRWQFSKQIYQQTLFKARWKVWEYTDRQIYKYVVMGMERQINLHILEQIDK